MHNADGGELPLHVATPAGSPRALVVVAHEIFGLTPHIRSVCDRLAAVGYLAVAPDLFCRVRKGHLAYDPVGKAEGLRIKAAIGEPAMLADIERVIDGRAAGLPSAVIGFCLGGTLAWLCGARGEVAAAVCYYAVRMEDHLGAAPKCPVLMHFGRTDPASPPGTLAALRRAAPDADILEYDAGHAFNRDDDVSYVPQAAALAWERTLAFFDRHLAGAR